MKKAKLSILALALATVTFTSCKKGENDPGLTLSSRKSRVEGEWTVDKWSENSTYNYTNSDGDVTTWTDVTAFDGSTYTSTSSTTQDGNTTETTTTGTVTKNMITFTKDGTFTIEQEYNYTEEDVDTFGDEKTTTTTVTTISSTTSGTWNFLGKVEDEYKNKERMVLNMLESKETTTSATTEKVVNVNSGVEISSDSWSNSGSTTDTYSNGDLSQVWALDKLASKEMDAMVELDGNGTSSSSFTFDGTTNSSSTSYTQTGMVEVNLSQD